MRKMINYFLLLTLGLSLTISRIHAQCTPIERINYTDARDCAIPGLTQGPVNSKRTKVNLSYGLPSKNQSF
jgi:hypothetical protein